MSGDGIERGANPHGGGISSAERRPVGGPGQRSSVRAKSALSPPEYSHVPGNLGRSRGFSLDCTRPLSTPNENDGQLPIHDTAHQRVLIC